MKISIVSQGDIPSQWAHGINSVKHAKGFYDLGHQISIYTVNRLYEDLLKLRIQNINKYYGLNPSIKIKYFRDNSLFYFNDIIPKILKSLKISYLNSISRELYDPKLKLGENQNNKVPKLKYKFQKLKTNFYLSYNRDPEKKISESLKKERCEFCYSRAFRTVYYNILNKIPSVLECHEAHIWKPKVKMILNMGRNDNFKGIITISEILKTWYINAGFPEEKILVIDDAIDLTKYDLVKMNKSHLRELLKLPKNKSIIMYTGSLFQGRGIDTIIDAADKFENKNVLFLIIGGKSGEIRYWSKYKESKRNDFNLKFTGFIQNSKIPLYHKAADILLAPYSLSCPTVEWMSPIKIFEYMGSKVPIIASNVNRIKEICQNGECMFFEENNPVDLAKKIDILLSDNNLKSNYVKKAYNTVKKHTYQKRCKKILNFFLFK